MAPNVDLQPATLIDYIKAVSRSTIVMASKHVSLYDLPEATSNASNPMASYVLPQRLSLATLPRSSYEFCYSVVRGCCLPIAAASLQSVYLCLVLLFHV